MLQGLETDIDLGSAQFLPSAYQAGNIASITYGLDGLPANPTLGSDLQRFAQLYIACVEAKTNLVAAKQVSTTAHSGALGIKKPNVVLEFRPKDAADYLAHVGATIQRRSRKHEALIADFGAAVQAAGGIPYTTVHPRDMTVDFSGEHWLIEAKTVGPAAYRAVREAIAQLLE